jgi:twinkle protein
MEKMVDHRVYGLCPLADLPQRGSIENLTFGIGWSKMDEIFKFYPGQFTVVTGIAGHGKSTFVFNALCKMAHEQGIKCFLYVPENEGYLRQKLRGMWPGDEESWRCFAKHQCFVQTSNRELCDDEFHTIDFILSQAAKVVKHFDIKVVVIDPWNELDRAKPRDMMLTDYIAWCLMQVKDFCRTMDVSVIMVAHPTKAVTEDGGRVPTLADIEGSMNWFNKCDNGLIVHRNHENGTIRVHSAKVRETGAGKIGHCDFSVDWRTGIFMPLYQ